jgi:hypothetical protein
MREHVRVLPVQISRVGNARAGRTGECQYDTLQMGESVSITEGVLQEAGLVR